MADLLDYFLLLTYFFNISILFVIRYTFRNKEYRKIILNSLKNNDNLKEISSVVESVLIFQVYMFLLLNLYSYTPLCPYINSITDLSILPKCYKK